MQETQSRLTEEFSAIAKDYCDITWGKALDAARVPADSSLKRPESIYYDSDIQELPGSDSPPPEQPAPVSEVPTANQALPAPVESQQIPTKMLVKGKKLRLPRVRTITKKRIKARLQILLLLSPNELLTPKLPRQKLRILVLVLRL